MHRITTNKIAVVGRRRRCTTSQEVQSSSCRLLEFRETALKQIDTSPVEALTLYSLHSLEGTITTKLMIPNPYETPESGRACSSGLRVRLEPRRETACQMLGGILYDCRSNRHAAEVCLDPYVRIYGLPISPCSHLTAARNIDATFLNGVYRLGNCDHPKSLLAFQGIVALTSFA